MDTYLARNSGPRHRPLFRLFGFEVKPVVENDKLLGCVTTQDIKDTPRPQWPERTVGDVLRPCWGDNTVPPCSDTAKVLAHMMRPDAPSRLMVVENERLLGVVSLKDLKSFIALKLDLEPTAH